MAINANTHERYQTTPRIPNDNSTHMRAHTTQRVSAPHNHTITSADILTSSPLSPWQECGHDWSGNDVPFDNYSREQPIILGYTLEFKQVVNNSTEENYKSTDRTVSSSEVLTFFQALATMVTNNEGDLMIHPEIESMGEYGPKGKCYFNFKNTSDGPDPKVFLDEYINILGPIVQYAAKNATFLQKVAVTTNENIGNLDAPPATIPGASFNFPRG